MLAAKYLWVEALVTRGMKHINNKPPNSKERVWENDFIQPITNCWHMKTNRPNCLNWQLMMSEEGFANWRLNLGCNSLLFDGASKGNPWLDGQVELFFILEGTS